MSGPSDFDPLGSLSDVVKRFLVTKEGAKIALGTTTKYLEIMYDGTVRIRDAKKNILNDVIKRPLAVFADSGKNSTRIYMDGARKKRFFKFSSIEEKATFFKELRHKQKSRSSKNKATVEPFQFAPYEVVGFFIRGSTVSRAGSNNVYDRHLIAITNYRMVIIDIDETLQQNQLNRGDPMIPALSVAHHSVIEYSIDASSTSLTLETKDYRTITIDLSTIKNATLRTQSLEMMKRYLIPMSEKDIFAFSGFFSETRIKTPSHSESDLSKLQGFPEIGKVKPFKKVITSKIDMEIEEFNGIFLRLQDSRFHQRHTRHLMKKEYQRLGWIPNDKSSPFRISEINENYKFCPTYPEIVMLPATCDDELLTKAAAHRSRKRHPAIIWSNCHNVTIARSAQPQSGIQQKRNTNDEKLLRLLNEVNQSSDSYVICDCRPRVNAIANQVKGKGYERTENYERTHIIFFDIQNIHQMRASVQALKKCCTDQSDPNWLLNLHETKWFQHLSFVLQCARRCANMVDKDRYSLLIHCSDGWDRTAQVSALTELLLDPYYRTFDGFLILIQKEWLWFGHKFADRVGNYTVGGIPQREKERSPIFLQFLDATFQIMMQFPWAFDFAVDVLLEFVEHSHSGRFGDFFCNCMRERAELALWVKTPSLFKYLHGLWKLGKFRNPDYIPTKAVLKPRYSVRDMRLWDEVYCRFTKYDKDRISPLSFDSYSSRVTKKPMRAESISVPMGFKKRSDRVTQDLLRNSNSNSNSNDKTYAFSDGADEVDFKDTAHNSQSFDFLAKGKPGKQTSKESLDSYTVESPLSLSAASKSSAKKAKTKKAKTKAKTKTKTKAKTKTQSKTKMKFFSSRKNKTNKNSSNSDDSRNFPHSDDDDDDMIPSEVSRIKFLEKKVRQLQSLIRETARQNNNSSGDMKPLQVAQPLNTL